MQRSCDAATRNKPWLEMCGIHIQSCFAFSQITPVEIPEICFVFIRDNSGNAFELIEYKKI